MARCRTCFKWFYLRCSLLSSKFNALGSLHLWNYPPCSASASPWDPQSSSAVFFVAPRTYTSSVQFDPSGPPMPLQSPTLLSPTNILHSFSPSRYSSFCTFPTLLCFWLFFYTPVSYSSPDSSRNPILTHLPYSGSLVTLLCDLILLAPGPAFF